MLNDVDKKLSELIFVNRILAISGWIAIAWYTFSSFKGVYNPLYSLIVWSIKYTDKPQILTEQLPAMKVIICMATFCICALIADCIVKLLVKTYARFRFGSAYYSTLKFSKK